MKKNSLKPSERAKFETLFRMDSGYVLNFSDATFASFFGEVADVDIHSDRYCKYGTSKAKKLRAFWELENDQLVGSVLTEMLNLIPNSDEHPLLLEHCKAIATRLLGNGTRLSHLKAAAVLFSSEYISTQIERMEKSYEQDPALAIGTAKELIETCCKSILKDLNVTNSGASDIPTLTKTTLKELNLVPESVDNASRGKDAVKRILQNLGQIGNNISELRNLYGTGHGKESTARGLSPRHAKLAIGSAATLVTFLFETHQDRQRSTT